MFVTSNNFKFLGCEISYKKDKQQRLAKFAQILGILNNFLNQIWSRMVRNRSI